MQPRDDAKLDWDALYRGSMSGDKVLADLFLQRIYEAIPFVYRRMDPAISQDEIEELRGRVVEKLHARAALKQYQGDSSFIGWLWKVLWSVRADYLRQKKRERGCIQGSKDDELFIESAAGQEELPPSKRINPADAAEFADLKAVIVKCLHLIPSADYDLLKRRLLDHDSFEDIAAALKISPKIAHTRFFRARQRLIDALAKFDLGPEITKGSRKDSLVGNVRS